MSLTPAQIEARRAGGRARARQFLADPDYQRQAGQARAKDFDHDYQSAARACRSIESLRAAGKKAFATLVRKHGFDGALEHLAQWRRDHPSALERTVAEWLDARQIGYQREKRVAGVYVDFLLADGHTVVFVDGEAMHTNGVLDDRDRTGRDALHDMALAANGYRVFRLREAAIKDKSAFTCLIAYSQA